MTSSAVQPFRTTLSSSSGPSFRRTMLLFSALSMLGGVDAASVSPVSPSGEAGKTCLIQEVCGEIRLGPSDRLSIPCASLTSPAPLKKEDMRKKLEEHCPMYRGVDRLCCSDESLASMLAHFEAASQLLGDCSECWRNYRNLWCSFSCSPDQNDFLRYANSSVSPPPIQAVPEKQIQKTGEGPQARAIDFFLDPATAKGVISSCAKVRFGDRPALSELCGLPADCAGEEMSDTCIQSCLKGLGTANALRHQPTSIAFYHKKTESKTPMQMPVELGECRDPPAPALRQIEQQWMDDSSESEEELEDNELLVHLLLKECRGRRGRRELTAIEHSSFLASLQHNLAGNPIVVAIIGFLSGMCTMLALLMCMQKGRKEAKDAKGWILLGKRSLIKENLLPTTLGSE